MSHAQISIVPLPVGAEVAGLRVGAEGDPEIRSQLYQAWLKHGVLLFKNVDSIERHLALSRCFGELEIHPFPPARAAEHELLIEIGGKKRTAAYVYDGAELRINRIAWHRDTAYTPDICKGAMLRMVDVPTTAGETMIADTAAAYDDLPADVKAKLEGLEYKATLRLSLQFEVRPGAFWKTFRPATPEEDPQGRPFEVDKSLEARYPSVVHPVVMIHPESGRKCLFISPTYVDFFLGLSQAESDALLAYLVDHMLKPAYVYKHKWSANEAIVWDNRRVMHASPGNKPSEPRKGLRTTLAGSLRTGRYFEQNAVAARAAVAMAD
jgi:taurine dioxygenase